MIWIIIILVIFYFIARPAWRVYKAYRDPQKAMEDFLRRNGFSPASEPEPAPRDRGGKGGWSAPRPRKKKIDPAAGDYVRFTTLPPGAGPSPSSAATTGE
ncbi:MAG: hypothetical protein K2O33_06355, partial [Muribaculaceae bacterium]|nr:hypothetical protein [Muribaculaceae bacterium]